MMANTSAVLRSAADRLGAWVAAQPGDPDPSSGHGPEWGKAAPAGLLIWLFMGTALFFLIRSMNRHMKRVPKSFGADADTRGPAAREAGTVGDPGAEPTESAGGAEGLAADTNRLETAAAAAVGDAAGEGPSGEPGTDGSVGR